MKWLLALISILVGFIALVVVVGLLLPVKHRVSASAHFSIGTVQLWEVVTNYGNYPTWRTGVVAVERLADRNGHAVWKEFESTNTGVPYETVESIIHRRLVRRIADLTLPYGGTWTLDFETTAEGTLLTITEDGEVYNPIYRFVSRFIIGHTQTIDSYLNDLGIAIEHD